MGEIARRRRCVSGDGHGRRRYVRADVREAGQEHRRRVLARSPAEDHGKRGLVVLFPATLTTLSRPGTKLQKPGSHTRQGPGAYPLITVLPRSRALRPLSR